MFYCYFIYSLDNGIALIGCYGTVYCNIFYTLDIQLAVIQFFDIHSI